MGDVFKVVKLVDAPVVISGNVTLTGGVAVAASGNTAGTMATISNGTAVLAGGNNVTLSQSNNTISIIAGGGTGGGGGVAISAGTNSTSTGTVVFANSNGISFGMDTNGVVTGTVQTNYLTTAMASDAGTNFVATSNSSLFQHTSATSAITSNAMNTSERGNYFYTSNNTFANNTHTHGNIAFSGTNVSGSFTSASDGLSIQLSGGAGAAGNTGYLSAGTTNASLGTVSLQNGSGVSWGINGQTLTASVKTDYLTTAAVSDHSHGNPTLALTNLTGTTASNSGGFTLSLSAGAAGAADGINALVVNAGASTQSTTLTLSNSNNVSFGINAGVITASASFNQTVQPAVAQLNGSSGTMSLAVGSSLSASSNASTITFGLASNITTALQSAGAYLTTAANSTHSHGNPTLALTNLSGTTASASDGLTLSLSAAAPGAGGGFTNSYFNPQDAYMQVAGQQGLNTLHIQPCKAPTITFDRIMIPIHNTGASNSAGTATLTLNVGVYTKNASTLSLSTSWSGSQTYVNNSQNSSSLFRGIRLVSVPVAGGHLLNEGQYWVGILSSTATAGNNQTLSQVLCSQLASNFSGLPGASIANSYQFTRGLGRYSVTTGALPNTIGFSEIYGTESNVLRQPIFYFLSGTV